MCRVIAIANQKGGVGKTTTCVNLGIGLAREGKKVLLIEADAQGSMAVSLGIAEPDELDVTLVNIMEKVINDEDLEPGEGIIHHEEGIDFVPANIELAGLETSLVNVMSREMVLRQYLYSLKGQYDYILIDCMPSLGMITINALVAADSVLIPVEAAYLPVKGLQQLIKTIGRVHRKLNPGLSIMGISKAYKMKYDAMKHQGSKGDKFTADAVGEAAGDSGRTVQRYIRLAALVPELLTYVDAKKVSLVIGEMLSYLKVEEQGWLVDAIQNSGVFPSKAQAEALKESSKAGKLAEAGIYAILVKKDSGKAGVTISAKRLSDYFPPAYTKEQMEQVIYLLLDKWKQGERREGFADAEDSV